METRTALEWTRRLSRVRRLREDRTAAEQLLGFYEEVLRVQSDIAEELSGLVLEFQPNTPFRQQIDVQVPLKHLPSLLDVTMRLGTEVLANAAQEFANDAETKLRKMLQKDDPSLGDSPERFFFLCLLQPAAEHLAAAVAPVSTSESRCPICDSLPLLAILRPEGDGAKRFLQCSFCLHEWAYRRVLCPWCGETDKEKLPRYSADECNYVRVEACDTCKHYLKSVDLTVNGNAVAMVDEVALAALDVWAAEQGFKKIARNLLGV